MPKPDSFFPWYIAKYMADTMDLSTVEHGAYLLLLAALWMADGKLPNDPARLAAITKMRIQDWKKIGPNLISRFCRIEGAPPGFVTQKRVVAELIRAKEMIEKKRIAGHKSAVSRQHMLNTRSTPVRTGYPTDTPTQPPTQFNPTPTPPPTGGQTALPLTGGPSTNPPVAWHNLNDPPPVIVNPGPMLSPEAMNAYRQRRAEILLGSANKENPA